MSPKIDHPRFASELCSEWYFPESAEVDRPNQTTLLHHQNALDRILEMGHSTNEKFAGAEIAEQMSSNRKVVVEKN